jgi:hypothetical protein
MRITGRLFGLDADNFCVVIWDHMENVFFALSFLKDVPMRFGVS